MKKIISLITIIAFLTVLILTGNTYAATLDNLNIDTDKTIIRPGEEVTVTIQFGQSLGAYTFDVSYDNNIFEYVTSEGGTASDTTDKVKVVYYDTTGGSNPRTDTSVTFRAKADITTSNPTEFTVTAEGLANADASVTFDDITTPIIKNVTVEPEYIDYTLQLEYVGDIIKEQEKEISLSYSSSMGHYYEHARLIAEATTPVGATAQLLATDEAGLEHDIIDSGWGDAQGYEIGGKDVFQVLNARGIFSEAGDYSITLKLIDRDNSDQVIAEETFYLTVIEAAITTPPTDNEDNVEITPPEEETGEPEEEIEEDVIQEIEQEKAEETPITLPKTGINQYVPVIGILILLVSGFVYYNKRK